MDEDTLVFYIHNQAGDLARILGLKPERESYNDVVDDARRAAGLDDLAQAENVELAIAAMEYAFWRHAESRTAAFYTMSTADGERRERKQIHDNAAEMAQKAETRLYAARGENTVRVTYRKAYDPYQPDPNIARRRAWWHS